MCKSPFGLQVNHACTAEKPDDMYRIEYRYYVNRTGPARTVNKNNTPPEVTIDVVKKQVEKEAPSCICIPVNKETYQKMRAALEAIQGLGLPDSLKMYVGQDILPVNDANVKLWKTNIANYIARVNLFSKIAAGALCRGEYERQMQYIYSRSPDAYTLALNDCYKDGWSDRDWAVHLIESCTTFMFGGNKLWNVHKERLNTSAWMEAICSMYQANTCPSTTPDLLPYFENAPFKTIRGVITVTDNMQRMLVRKGVLSHCYNATMIQKISFPQLSQNDLHPFDEYAPHDSVTVQSNGVYRRKDDGGMLVREVKTELESLDYFTHAGGIYVVFTIKDGNLGKNTMIRLGMKQTSRFDSIIPTGIRFTQSSSSSEVDSSGYPVPQETSFRDSTGLTQTLAVKRAASFINGIFIWGRDECPHEFDRDRLAKIFPEEQIKDEWSKLNVPKTMMFFYVNKDGQLQMYKYTICNRWMNEDIFLTNMLTLYNSHSIEVPDVDTEADLDKNISDLNSHITNEKGNIYNDLVLRHISQKESEFRNRMITNAYRALGNVRPPSRTDWMSPKDYMTLQTNTADYSNLLANSTEAKIVWALKRCYVAMLTSENENLASNNWIDNGFNPGVGVLWIKPQFCETESCVIAQPGGYTCMSANPVLTKELDMTDESKNILFTFQQYSCRCPNGLTNTSIKVPGAYMNVKITSDTNSVVDPSNYERTSRTLSCLTHCREGDGLIKITGREEISKWWPILCQPQLPVSFFEKGFSPVGRLVTPWTDEKTFQHKFFDVKEKDVVYTNNFTINEVFANPAININTYFYNTTVLEDPECPLNKYLVYNSQSSQAVSSLKLNHARRSGLQPNSTSRKKILEDTPVFKDDTDFSRKMGIALCKCCWTHTEILKQEDQYKKPRGYSTNAVIQSITLPNHFYITGSDGLEKFYIHGLPHMQFAQ